MIRACVAPLSESLPRAIYPVSGYRGHHTVTRVEKDDKGYVMTTYNAGGGAINVSYDDDKVYAMVRQRVKPYVNIKDLVRLVMERKIQSYPNRKAIDAAIEGVLEPMHDFRVEPQQHKGNCTTRSTREMLKDVLGKTVFEDLHRHVSNPEVCDPADVMAALQMRREALADYLKKEHAEVPRMPLDQSVWGESVIEIQRRLGLDGSHLEEVSWVKSVQVPRSGGAARGGVMSNPRSRGNGAAE